MNRMNSPLASSVRRLILSATCVWTLTACSPTYNWREVAMDGDLAGWLPCKPERVSRDAHLAGGVVLPMSMLACEAGGQNWAIVSAGVTEPTQLAGMQQALNEALAANLSTRLGRAQVPKAPGLAAAHELRRYELHGRRPDGSAVTIDLWSFVRGTQVYQASVIRPEASGAEPEAQDARNTFFGALRWGR